MAAPDVVPFVADNEGGRSSKLLNTSISAAGAKAARVPCMSVLWRTVCFSTSGRAGVPLAFRRPWEGFMLLLQGSGGWKEHRLKENGRK